MMIVFVRKNQVIAVSKNAIAVPRIGETVVIDDIRLKVFDVIWHFDKETWVEIHV